MSQIGVPIVGIKYTASEAARWMYGRTNGVFSIDDNELRVSAVSGRTISVAPGGAVLTPNKFQSIIFTNDTDFPLTLDVADAYFPTTYLVAIRWRTTVTGTHPSIILIKGTPSSNALFPVFYRDTVWDLVLAAIRFPAGAVTVLPEYITDLRMDERYSGLVRDGVVKIPTQALIDQWNQWFSTSTANFTMDFQDWFDQLQNTLDENQLTNLYRLITDAQLDIDSLESITTEQSSLILGLRRDIDSLEIQRGSNTNGNWIKYSDGMLLQWLNTQRIEIGITNPYGPLFTTTFTWTYPMSFVSMDHVSCGMFRWYNGGGWGTVQSYSSTAAIMRGYDVGSLPPGQPTALNFIAIGKWK